MSQNTSSTPGNSSDPNSIERDLDQTRSRLGSHLSELQDKFSPGQVLDDLMGYFRGSDGAEFGRTLMDSVRANPMPAAVTAIGLAWLMASKPTGQAASPAWDKFGASPPLPMGPHLYGREDYGATLTRVRLAEQDLGRQPSEAEHSYSSRLDEVRGQAIGLARHSQESTESFSQRVKDALTAAQQAIVGAAGSLASQASAAGSTVSSLGASAQTGAQGAMQSALGVLSQAGTTGGKAGGSLVTTIAENPVMLGAIGLAAGALLGALLPVSEQEEAALGGIAGQARDATTSLAQQGLASGKAVAQTVMEKGRASVDAHGLAGGKTAGQFVDAALSGELAGNAKAVLQEVLQTGDEAVRKEVESSSPQPNKSSS